jgi:hypothetical protein
MQKQYAKAEYMQVDIHELIELILGVKRTIFFLSPQSQLFKFHLEPLRNLGPVPSSRCHTHMSKKVQKVQHVIVSPFTNQNMNWSI